MVAIVTITKDKVILKKTGDIGKTEDFLISLTLLELFDILDTEAEKTCNTSSQLLQSLSDTWKMIKKSFRELVEFLGRIPSIEYLRILPSQEETARHKQGREAGISKYFIKWREKYRPP